MTVRLLREAEIRDLIDPKHARVAVRRGFEALAADDVLLPAVLHMTMPNQVGDIHVKGAYIRGAPTYTVKAASGFYRNPDLGLPVATGVSMVFSARTGLLRSVLFDNGYLTELRTGAAGAVAADLLAAEQIETVAIIGAGTQARYQLAALLRVRSPDRVLVCARTHERALAFAREMQNAHGVPIEVVSSVSEAVQRARIVVTTTPSRSPLIQARWIQPGSHVTAVGSDVPGKQELATEALLTADLVAVDDAAQSRQQGELQHVLFEEHRRALNVQELAHIAAGQVIGRSDERQITIADLTGVGVQDAVVADFVCSAADRLNAGTTIDT